MVVLDSARASKVMGGVPLPRVPRIGVPFLDAIQVVHGPPGLIGRFLLQVDSNLKSKGLTLDFGTFEEVIEVHLNNKDSWPAYNPMFDPRIAVIEPHNAMCLNVRDAAGRIVATTAGKCWDGTHRSFKEIVDTGDFYAIKKGPGYPEIKTAIGAPSAATLKGQLVYCGGIWVHPEVRGLRLPALLSRVVNACMLTLWNPDFVIGFVLPEVLGSDLHKRYGYENSEPSLVVTTAGVKTYEGIFLWMTGDDATLDLARFLDELWPKIDPTVVA
jgi:hypothetical protein